MPNEYNSNLLLIATLNQWHSRFDYTRKRNSDQSFILNTLRARAGAHAPYFILSVWPIQTAGRNKTYLFYCRNFITISLLRSFM